MKRETMLAALLIALLASCGQAPPTAERRPPDRNHAAPCWCWRLDLQAVPYDPRYDAACKVAVASQNGCVPECVDGSCCVKRGCVP